MKTFLSLLSLLFLALGISCGLMVVAATASVASGVTPGEWVLFMAPLPFGPLLTVGLFGMALKARTATY